MGGTEFIIGFEGSQALPVCPSGKCKHLTGTIEVQFFFFCVGGITGCVRAKHFKITIGTAACEAYRATWNLGTNSAFALGSRKTTENLFRVMKNVVIWDIKTQFVLHRRHITSTLEAQPVNAM
jgi:hypothetical protein